MDSDENDFRNGFRLILHSELFHDLSAKDKQSKGPWPSQGSPDKQSKTFHKICRWAHIWSKNNKNCNKVRVVNSSTQPWFVYIALTRPGSPDLSADPWHHWCHINFQYKTRYSLLRFGRWRTISSSIWKIWTRLEIGKIGKFSKC